MSHASVSTQSGVAIDTWRTRENLLPGAILLVLSVLAWVYTLSRATVMSGVASTGEMGDMPMAHDASSIADLGVFVLSWGAMMAAMMLPAALPLILLYSMVSRKRMSSAEAHISTATLVAGYLGVWTLIGLPVYAYNGVSEFLGSRASVLPGILLIAGGAYQFTALKHGCHSRCSSPLMFLMQHFRPGTLEALRLGVRHGVDCLGRCVGLMLALVALGMMNVAWMLTAAVIIFAEKSLPGGHRVARPLGVVLLIGGLMLLTLPLFRSDMVM